MIHFFNDVMQRNNIDGKVLCCVVIPDYSRLYKLEWDWKNTFARYHMLHNDPPALQCCVSKAYLDDEAFEKKTNKIDRKIDIALCKEIRVSNLAFIAFDRISVAKKVKDLITYSSIK